MKPQRKKRRNKTIDESVDYFCKRNRLTITTQKRDLLIRCFLLYGDGRLINKSRLNRYLVLFIKNDLNFWKQRIRRLLCISPKSVTKKKFLLLYGKHQSILKWKNYTTLQSKTNQFEYKNVKYGWTIEQFNEYNKSRAITTSNMIKKYGKIEGNRKYKEYVETQRYSGCSVEYFIDKYGYELGMKKYSEVCHSKGITLPNFIGKYGELEGRRKYRDYLEHKPTFYSKISQKIFWEIQTENCYFAEKNKEFGLLSEDGYYFYDFVDVKLKKCIEFNGDYWHCNPKIYAPDYITHYGYTASDIWKKDNKKNDFIKSKGYDIMIVWESDYNSNPDLIVNNMRNFLND